MKAKLAMLKKIGVRSAVAAGTAVAAVSAHAVTTAPDFSTLTSSVDFSTVITAVLAVAAIMVGVYVAIKGAKFVISAVRGA